MYINPVFLAFHANMLAYPTCLLISNQLILTILSSQTTYYLPDHQSAYLATLSYLAARYSNCQTVRLYCNRFRFRKGQFMSERRFDEV